MIAEKSAKKKKMSIVNLGLGIGNLENELVRLGLAQKINMTGVDNNQDSLNFVKKRLANKINLNLLHKQIPNFKFPKADLYISSLTLHHLNGNKEDCFKQILKALPQGGAFLNFEMFRSNSPEGQNYYWNIIKNNLEPHFSFTEWMKESQKVDHFWTLEDELALFRKLGAQTKIISTHHPFALYMVTPT